MKFLFDLFPVILFFIVFKFFDIYAATAATITATLAMIVYSKLRHGKVEKMLLINGAVVSVLGGITLLLHDQTYIMWKPTVLYWLFAGILLISNLFFRKNLIQKIMGNMFSPPANVWDKLNWIWAVFFIALGFLNLYVARHFSTSAWVNFKLFGVTGLLFTFMAGQALALKNYFIDPEQDKTDDNKNED